MHRGERACNDAPVVMTLPPCVIRFGTARDLNPHIKAQDDVVSPEAYKPLGTSVKLEFEFNAYPANERDCYMRIDVIRPRKILLDSIYHDLTMPKGLGQFCNLGPNPCTCLASLETVLKVLLNPFLVTCTGQKLDELLGKHSIVTKHWHPARQFVNLESFAKRSAKHLLLDKH